MVESSKPNPRTNVPPLVAGGCDMELLSSSRSISGELITSQLDDAMPKYCVLSL
jgi:hypothetical protein